MTAPRAAPGAQHSDLIIALTWTQLAGGLVALLLVAWLVWWLGRRR